MKRRNFVAGMTAAFGLAACGKETEPAKQENGGVYTFTIDEKEELEEECKGVRYLPLLP